MPNTSNSKLYSLRSLGSGYVAEEPHFYVWGEELRDVRASAVDLVEADRLGSRHPPAQAVPVASPAIGEVRARPATPSASG